MCQCYRTYYSSYDNIWGENLKKEWLCHEVPGTVYGMSDKGWMETSLLDSWFDHFLQHTVPGRPLLLLLRRWSQYTSFPKYNHQGNGKRCYYFMLTTTFITRHSTVRCWVYGPLKQHWSRECHEWMASN